MLIDILIILGLILLNGMFSMAELAIVSSRKSRLQALAEKGSGAAVTVLHLKENPNQFLSVVQIGITLIGILSGAYSGATLAEPLAAYLNTLSWAEGAGYEVALTLVVGGITYLSLIVGELVPKQIALKFSDSLALVMGRPIYILSLLTRPVVIFLNLSSHLLIKLLRIPAEGDTGVSQDEVKAIIAEGTQSGVFNDAERRMMEGVLRLSDLPIKAAMTPRQDIVWFETGEDLASVATKIREHHHSHYLLRAEAGEEVVGIISAKDIVAQLQARKTLDLHTIAMQPLTLPETASVHDAITQFRSTRAHIALVVDEYGSLEGIITFKDILEAIVGSLPEPTDSPHPLAVQRGPDSWLLDGMLPIYEAEAILDLKNMRDENEDYATLAGFILHHLMRLPKEGDVLEWQGFRFEIIDMDERRIDKVLATRQNTISER